MGDVEVTEPAVGHVRRARDSRGCGHPCHADRSNESAKIKEVGLHDVHASLLDHPAKTTQAAFLFAAGHGSVS